MRYRTLFVALVLVASSPARAQHPVAGSVSAPDAHACGMCHASHGAESRAYALRMDEVAGPESAAPGLGDASQSCLRCHVTPGRRARQPEFAEGGSPGLEAGSYLGLDLSDDHPLGRVEPSRWPRLEALWRDRRRDRPDPIARPGVGAETRSLECTTCHDPHDRSPGFAGVEAQKTLCGGCHEPARYVLAGHASLACTDCHELHGGNEADLLAERSADVLCRACHEAGGVPLDRRAAAASTAKGPQGHIRAPRGSCLGCHAVHR